MNIQQQICEKLYKTARWRGRKIIEYPNDRRNLAAEADLQTLAREVALLGSDDPVLLQLEAVCTGGWNEIVADKIRGIGFKAHYRDGHEFLAALIGALGAAPIATTNDLTDDNVNPFI